MTPPDQMGRAVYVTRMYSGVRGAPHRLQAVRPPTHLAVVFVHVLCLIFSFHCVYHMLST